MISVTNKEFISKLIKILEPVKEFDQKNGIYEDHCPSCVAAHIAYWFTDCRVFTHGIFEFYNMFARYDEWSSSTLNKTLHYCGAPKEPFGKIPWTTHPAVVFKKLLKLDRPVTDEEYKSLY